MLTVLLVFSMIVPTVIAEGNITPSVSDVKIAPTLMPGDETTPSEEGISTISEGEETHQHRMKEYKRHLKLEQHQHRMKEHLVREQFHHQMMT